MTKSRAIRCLFFAYWAALTFLLLVYNPFEWVPVDEELVEKNFGIGLDPHTGTFFLLGILAWASRFARPWWVLLGLIAYGGLTEYLQGFTGRFPDWVDFGHNTLGLVYATLVVLAWRWCWSRAGREKTGNEKTG